MNRWVAWGALLLASCGVELRVPSDVEILCTQTSDCPADFDCNQDVRRCVSRTNAEPLQVISIAPTTSYRVVVVFNKPLTDAALEPSFYTIDPGIAVEAVELIDTNHTLILHTSRQKSRQYDLRIERLSDAFGYVIADEHSVTTFTGLGDPIDPFPLETTAPIDRSYLTDATVQLQWTPSRDAERYFVVVALDDALTQLHPDTPDVGYFTTSTPSLTVSVTPESAYFWKVTSDVSDVYSAVARYSSVQHSVHVRCDVSWDCDSGPGGLAWEAGTRAQPFWSIVRAVEIVRAREADVLNIAGRGGDAAYRENVAITRGDFDVLGGWDSTFTTRDPQEHPAIIDGGIRSLQLIDVRTPLFVDGLTLLASRDGTALLISNSDDSVVVRNCDAGITEGAGNALVIDSSPPNGPTVEDSRLEGKTIVRGSAYPVLRRNRMRTTAGPTVELVGPTAGRITDSSIEPGGVVLTRQGTACPMTTISRDVIVAHDAPALDANLTCSPSTRILVSNNVFRVTGAGNLVGLSLASADSYELQAPIFNLVHNTIIGGSTGGTTRLIAVGSTAIYATNNIIACEGTGRVEGVFLRSTLYNFLSFQSNAFVGCAVPINFADAFDYTNESDIASFHDPEGAPGRSFRNNRVITLAIADAFVGPDDLHLRLSPDAGPLRTEQLRLVQGGRDTAANNCGATGQNASCGFVLDDLDGVQRTPSPSIGAYEREP